MRIEHRALDVHGTATKEFCLIVFVALWTGSASAQLLRVANTTLNLPAALPVEASGYTAENAFGSLTFTSPICIRHAPGQSSHLFVIQRGNGIERVDLAQNTKSTFLNLKTYLDATSSPRRRLSTNLENGILSMAFHPNYNQNGYFYVFYSTSITSPSNTDAQFYQRISRFQAVGTPGAYLQATTADPATEVPMITQRDEANNHNGGDMHFGADGYLYISTGDEGGANDTYNNARFINKDFFSAVLRIDVDQLTSSLLPNAHTNTPAGSHVASAVHANTYRIPADNPFIGTTSHHGATISASTVRTEFWACGLRNPWRMSFDAPSERLFLADVGQGSKEEVNIVTAGADLGWSYREGLNNFTIGPGGATAPVGFAPTQPIHEYGRSLGWSITGGVVSRGARLAELAGRYIFADYGSGRVWALQDTSGSWTSTQLFQDTGNNIAAFGTDPRNGDVLYCMLNSSIVKRIVRATGGGTPLPALLSQTGAFSNLTTLTPQTGIVGYDVNLPFWSDRAEKKRWFSIPNTSATMQWSQDGNWSFPNSQIWIKHFEVETIPGNPASKRKLETRFLVKNSDGAYGVTYRWRVDQSDADLVASSGINEILSPTKSWRYPSRAECMTCHTSAAGFALSFNTRQLNLDHEFSGQTQNQLQALAAAGYFGNALPAINSLPRHAAMGDTSQSLESRARAYLAVNCASCHLPGGGGGGSFDLRAHLTTENTGIINGFLNNTNGNSANRVIVPNDLTHSMALTRMQGAGGLNRMPPLGNYETDAAGVALLQAWIQNELPAWLSFSQWQTFHFGSQAVPEAAPDYDDDGDGRSNRLEFLARSNPRLADTSPLLKLSGMQGINVQLEVPMISNRALLIETSENLTTWQPWAVPNNTPHYPATGGGIRVIEGPRASLNQFFRARISE